MDTERIREEIGHALDSIEPTDRGSLAIWGSLAGVAILAFMVTAFAADAPQGPTPVERIGTVEAAISASQSSEATLEQRNAQLLHAVVVLSDDNEKMRTRVGQLEQKLDELARIPEFGKRLAAVEDDVAQLARTVPFGETHPVTAPTLTAPAAILTPPLASAPAAPTAETVAVANPVEPAPPPPEALEVASANTSATGKNMDRLVPIDPEPAPAPEPAASAGPASADSAFATPEPDNDSLTAEAPLAIDPTETASINPSGPIAPSADTETAGESPDAASGEGDAPLITEPLIAVAPIPERRPAQVATRTSFGVDLGTYPTIQMLESKWKVLAKKDPTLVKRLTPMVATRDGMMGNETHLIAGPFADAADAATACAKFKAMGASCKTTPYPGDRPL